MKLKHILLLSLILITNLTGLSYAYTTSISTIRTANDDIVTHTVTKGETAYSIAAKYHISVQQIYKLNPKAALGIKNGDKLLILRDKTITNYSDKTITNYSDHTIEAKETLFSVSRMYSVSVEDLKNANPDLTESTFSIGKSIKIPLFSGTTPTTKPSNSARTNNEYKVQKGETLYSIGRANNISVATLLEVNPSLKTENLREGMTIMIPNEQVANTNARSTYTNASATKNNVVRVGIFLPFTDSNGSVSKDKLAEYYEGFLLAVKDLKSKGLNAEIYAFDAGAEKDTKRLEGLIETYEAQNLQLIIGGVSKQQIDVLSNFSQKAGIKYVIPFGSSALITSSPQLYQMTSSHSTLYPEVTSAFVKKFANYNIIFVSEDGANNDKAHFVNNLKEALSKSGIESKTITKTNSISESIKATSSTANSIIIPTSSSEITLRKIVAELNMTGDNSVTLFGYPEWQTYISQTENLHKYNAYIYSIFFLNEQQDAVQNFANQFKEWYNKSLINSFPKWGYLGYDTGLYFLTALKQYGGSFENNISQMNVPTLQSSIHFEKTNNNGGFINNGIYFIHYNEDSSIEKINIAD